MNLLFKLATGGQPEHLWLNGGGGGKGGGGVQAVPQVTPPPPAEEASVDVEDTGMKKKVTQGKSELKIPLATAPSTGLKV